MKKILGILTIVLVSRFSFADPEPPSAGWNFGNVTYGQVGGSLVLNSLSDRYGISTYPSSTQYLGVNDFIQESGVKNQLAIDGYSQAWDYNPQYSGLYPAAYNQSLPTDVSLTKLSFAGLQGDPTKTQDVYVLTSEYNRLSSEGQASSIDTLNGNVSTLQTGLNTTNSNLAVTNTQVNTNTANIGNLYTGLNNETIRAQGVETGLQNQVNATNSRVDSLDNRVSNLERVKVMADVNVRLIDAKRYTVGFFDMYDGTNQRNFAFGARLTYKVGKSYEERMIEKQQKQIEALQRILTKIAQ